MKIAKTGNDDSALRAAQHFLKHICLHISDLNPVLLFHLVGKYSCQYGRGQLRLVWLELPSFHCKRHIACVIGTPFLPPQASHRCSAAVDQHAQVFREATVRLLGTARCYIVQICSRCSLPQKPRNITFVYRPVIGRCFRPAENSFWWTSWNLTLETLWTFLKPYSSLPWTNLHARWDSIALVSSRLVLRIGNLNLALTSDLFEVTMRRYSER